MYKWQVVPLCERQLRDVKQSDIINNGHFRSCDVYKGGGGYDKFPAICEKRLGVRVEKQFVVQLKGCIFCCPYCYVTQAGIWGDSVHYTSEQLVSTCIQHGLKVFHLMGGAPALYINNWKSIIELLPTDIIFHSDLLLMESNYSIQTLKDINRENCLYAVSIKGSTPEEFRSNTGRDFEPELFYSNLQKVIDSKIQFYFTFTGMSEDSTEKFKKEVHEMYGESTLNESFNIAIKQYKALED